MLKSCKVIMLRNEKAKIHLVMDKELILCDIECNKSPQHDPQHLYILSDDEIKEGDWVIANGTPYQVLDILDNSYKTKLCWVSNVNKIISSTDKSLNLPYPSESFVNKYIEKYNKNEKIDVVMVEYDNTITTNQGLGYNDINY